jgi:hypothetical protein
MRTPVADVANLAHVMSIRVKRVHWPLVNTNYKALVYQSLCLLAAKTDLGDATVPWDSDQLTVRMKSMMGGIPSAPCQTGRLPLAAGCTRKGASDWPQCPPHGHVAHRLQIRENLPIPI